jgi:anti-anti-sigma factor
VVVLTLAGRIGFQAAADLDRSVASATEGANHRLVIDLQGVDYLSSAAVAVLRDWAGRLRACGGQLILTGICEPVRIVLELGGVLPQVVIEDSTAQAIARTQSRPEPDS